MWIRILGILYNLSLVQAIAYNTKKKELFLHYGSKDVDTISFKPSHYGNEYGLTVYTQLMKKLEVYDSDPLESDRVLGIAGPPYEGAHPDAEFVTAADADMV